ncbi:hypothetical protein ACLOJK_037084 [Asimina triloba]
MDYHTVFHFRSRAPHRRAKVLECRNCASGSSCTPTRAQERQTSGSTSGARNFAHCRPQGTCSMSLKIARRDLRRGQQLRGWGRPPGPNIDVWRHNGITLGHGAV